MSKDSKIPTGFDHAPKVGAVRNLLATPATKPTGEYCKACGAPLTAAEAEAMREELEPLRGGGCEPWEWREYAAHSHGCRSRGCDGTTLASEG